MSLRRFSTRFRKSELGGLAGDTSYVAVWQGTVAIAELAQMALITHALGLEEYGRLALAVAFVTLVGGFFNMRVGIAATTHGAAPLARRDYRALSGVFRMAYLIDFGTATCAVLVLAVAAPILGPGLIGEQAVALVLLYSITLIGTAMDTTSFAVLRLLDRFKRVAVNSIIIEGTRLVLVITALAVDTNLVLVVAAVAASKLAGGFLNLATAAAAFRKVATGRRLVHRVGPMPTFERKSMLSTVFHTNLVAYARIAQVQVPTLLLGSIAGPTQTALYKVGIAVGGGLSKLIDPASAALLPRFTRLWAEGKRAELDRLVRHVTLVTVPVILVSLAVLVVFRDPILELLGGGSEATDAGTVLILGALGHACYALVFWRTNLLFAIGRAKTVSAVSIPIAAIQIAGVAIFAPSLGAEGAALAFLIARAINGIALTVAAIRALETAETPRTPALAGTGGG